MFKNIGVVLKKNASLDERSVVQDLITVLAKNALNIFAEEGANLSLAIEKNNENYFLVFYEDDSWKNYDILDFDLNKVNKAGARFDPDKTKWFAKFTF